MKSVVVVILMIVLSSCVGGEGAGMVKNEIDEFTGNRIKATTFVRASDHYAFSPSLFNFIRFRKINNSYILDLKTTLVSGAVFSIDRESDLMLKLKSGEIIKLKAMQHKVSCFGCGADGIVHSKVMGILQNYIIKKEQLKTLLQDSPVLMRLYLSTGYLEEGIPLSDAKIISKNAGLILEHLSK